MTILEWDQGTISGTQTGTVSLDTTSQIFGTDSIKVATSGAAAFNRWDLTVDVDRFDGIRFYVKMPSAWAGSSCNIASLRGSSNNHVFGIAIGGTGSPGQVRLTKANGTIVASSPNGTLAVEETYRFVLYWENEDDVDAAIFEVYELGSGDPEWSTRVTLAAHPELDDLPINRVDLGRINNSPALNDFYIDGVSITVGDWAAAEYLEPHPDDDIPDDPLPSEDYPILYPAEQDPDRVYGATVVGEDVITINQAPGTPAYVEWDLEDVPQLSVFVEFTMPDQWASASWSLIALRPNFATVPSAGTISGIGQPGQFRLVGSGGTTSQSPNNTLVLGRRYTACLQYDIINPANPRHRAVIFDTFHLRPVWDSGWFTDSNLAGFDQNLAYLQVGRNTGYPTVDELLIHSVSVYDNVDNPLTMSPVPSGSSVSVYVKTAEGLKTVESISLKGSTGLVNQSIWVL